MASVLKRTSIPVLHSAAALLRLADMPYNGINSFFMRVCLCTRVGVLKRYGENVGVLKNYGENVGVLKARVWMQTGQKET